MEFSMLLTPTVDREQIELAFPNLAEWIDRYLRSCRLESAKSVTLTHYGNALKRFLTWYEIEVPDGRISPDRAQEFRYWLAHKKQKYDDHPGRPTEAISLSPVTVKRTVGVVRTFFKWLHAKNYLSHNLAHWFPLPKGTMVTNRAIEPETLEALFRGAAMGEMPVRDVAIIALLADTGLRRRELVTTTVYKIRWLESGLTYIHDVEGKADKLRDVPFSPPVHEVLKAWLEERKTYALPNEPWLFIHHGTTAHAGGSLPDPASGGCAIRCRGPGVEHPQSAPCLRNQFLAGASGYKSLVPHPGP